MKEVRPDVLAEDIALIYIYTPLCGTCQMARGMLDKIEAIHNQDIFYKMNASLHPEFMQEHKIESVPCLLIYRHQEEKERIYAFRSIPNIYHSLYEYYPELFVAGMD